VLTIGRREPSVSARNDLTRLGLASVG
jgi:hypothetical protein